MSISETFEMVKSVLYAPITLLVAIGFILYISLVNYVTDYRQKEKAPKSKKNAQVVRRHRKINETAENQETETDDESDEHTEN